MRKAGSSDIECLKSISYFRSLPPVELRRLAAACTARTLRRGEVLFDEGESCRGLFIIAEGSIEVRQISFHGREQVLHTEGPGATLGESPLFDRGAYIASAVALEPTRALFLPRANLLDLCHRHPAVALAMLETLARRLRSFAGLVGDLAFRSITERLARYIASMAATGHPIATGIEVTLRLTQTQLAARLGTVRELVSRALSQLERDGIIARTRTRIVIRDPVRLDARARGES